MYSPALNALWRVSESQQVQWMYVRTALFEGVDLSDSVMEIQ